MEEDIYRENTLKQIAELSNLAIDLKAKIYLEYLITNLSLKYKTHYDKIEVSYTIPSDCKYLTLGIIGYNLWKDIKYQTFKEFIDLSYSEKDFGPDYKERGWGVRYWITVSGELIKYYDKIKKEYIALN